MNLRPLYALLLLSFIGELGACQSLFKKKDPDPVASVAPILPPPTVVAPVLPAPVAAVAPPTVDENAIPTPQDFEDEAFQNVTAANFKAQFTTLSTAIAKK